MAKSVNLQITVETSNADICDQTSHGDLTAAVLNPVLEAFAIVGRNDPDARFDGFDRVTIRDRNGNTIGHLDFSVEEV